MSVVAAAFAIKLSIVVLLASKCLKVVVVVLVVVVGGVASAAEALCSFKLCVRSALINAFVDGIGMIDATTHRIHALDFSHGQNQEN